MRRVLFWSHLLAGVGAALVILIMAATGVLLGFERQIVAWADRHANLPVAAPTTQPLPMDDLLARAAAAAQATPTAITLRAGASPAVEFAIGRERTLFLDGYTGAVLGVGSPGVRGFFHTVEDVHRWLGAAGEKRAAGRSITGAANLAFLLIVASGPFLWWPAKWTRQNLRATLLLRTGLGGKARDWNWHNALGIWSAAPLLIVAGSGVVMSYGWANNLLYRITGTEPPPAPARPATRPDRAAGRGAQARPTPGRPGTAPLEPLFARARRQSPAWQSIGLRLAPGPVAAFMIDEGSGGQPQKRAQLTLDRRTGATVRWEPFASNNAGRRLRMWARFAHTGEAFGLAGQVVATAVSAAACLLVWTGVALTWRRFRAWQSRRRRNAEPPLALAEVCASAAPCPPRSTSACSGPRPDPSMGP
jgi:uncharacterized iron-regulated membrane protein